MPEPDPVSVLSFIKEYFSLEDLKTLCFQLYVPFDDLAGEGREAKARELIAYMQNRGRMPDLTLALARERPEQYRINFGTTPQKTSKRLPNARNPRLVFISHAHQDAAFAHRLADDMRRENYEVWIAPDSIPLGERWVEAINRALQESGVFLLVSTPQAVESEWVQDETNYAVELAAKKLVRFIRLDVKEAEVPPLWTVRQHVSFHNNYRSGLKLLLAALQVRLDPLQLDPTGLKYASAAKRVKPEPIKSEPGTTDKTRKSNPDPISVKEQEIGPTPAPSKRLSWGLGVLVILIVVLIGWRLMAEGVGGNGANPTAEVPIVATTDPGGIAGTNATRTPTQPPTRRTTATTKPMLRPEPTDTPEPIRTTALTPTPRAEDSIVHVVQPGESLWTIAIRYAETLAMAPDDVLPYLMELNNYPTFLNPGDEILIVAGGVDLVAGTISPPIEETAVAGDVRTIQRAGINVEQVFVPAGSFMMGSEGQITNELPVHEVTLDAFWIDRREVTNAQYEACVSAGVCRPADDSSYTRDSYFGNPEYADYPVVNVTWEDARAFSEWAGGRLPTEAEWEYAARGPDSLAFPWGNELPSCEQLNFSSCIGDTSEAGSYPDGASWVGALDMAGNVWEWVNDWYDTFYYERSPAVNPPGPDLGDLRVMRGSSWIANGWNGHAAGRRGNDPAAGAFDVGFRVAEPLSDPDS